MQHILPLCCKGRLDGAWKLNLTLCWVQLNLKTHSKAESVFLPTLPACSFSLSLTWELFPVSAVGHTHSCECDWICQAVLSEQKGYLWSGTLWSPTWWGVIGQQNLPIGKISCFHEVLGLLILFLFVYKYKKDLNVQKLINHAGFCDPFGWNKINFNLSVFVREGAVVFIWQACGHALSEARSKTKHNKSVFTNLRKPALQSTY